MEKDLDLSKICEKNMGVLHQVTELWLCRRPIQEMLILVYVGKSISCREKKVVILF